MAFYEEAAAAARGGPLQQGDIVVNVPFVTVTASALRVATPGQPAAVAYDVTTGHVPPPNSLVLAGVECATGIVLNQSCDATGDLGRCKPILIARVRPIDETSPGFSDQPPTKRASRIRELANPGRTPNSFYLPALEIDGFRLRPSVVDLLDTARLPATDVAAVALLRRARLGVEALQALQERLGYMFGRYGAPDDLYFSPEEQAAAAAAAAQKAAGRAQQAAQDAAKATGREAPSGAR